MVFGREEFWLCKKTGWTCGINYGKKKLQMLLSRSIGSTFFRSAVIFRRAAKKLFLAFKLVFTDAFRGYFSLFSQMLAVIVQEWKFCCIWFQFGLQSQ